MGWKKLVILFYIFTISSCIPFKNYYWDKNGITKPRNANFDLSKDPYNIDKNDSISTNSIYIKEEVIEYKNGEKRKEKSYLRFFKNGRAFSGKRKNDKFNIQDYSDFSYGWICYFRINNHTQIVLEEFWVHETGRYKKKYGYIKNDSIYLFHREYKGKSFPKPIDGENCSIYVRKRVDSLKGIPNW